MERAGFSALPLAKTASNPGLAGGGFKLGFSRRARACSAHNRSKFEIREWRK